MTDSAEITRQAKSNLAFALQILPKERRDGMVTFYAFCRVVADRRAGGCPVRLEDGT